MKAPANFLDFLIKTGKSENTMKAYIHDVDAYLKWHLSKYEASCTDLSRECLLAYLGYLKESKALSVKTINRIISSLTKYNEYLVATGVQTSVVLNKNDYPKHQPTFSSLTMISENEIKQLLLEIKKSGNLRNYALVILMSNTGMRISEVLNMKMDDLNLNDMSCVIRSNKGGKRREILLNAEAITALYDYLSIRNVDSDYLFVSNRNGRLDETVVNRIFKQFSSKVTPRQLRNYFCIKLLEQGFSVFEVAKLLGHSQINTTLNYLKVIDDPEISNKYKDLFNNS